MSAGEWPIALTTLRPVSAGAVVWLAQGRMCLTVITKATFGLVPDGEARLVAPNPLTQKEQHRDGNPARSLLHGAETDPYKPRVDVLFSGHAYAPEGTPASAVAVRIGLYGEHTGLEKTLHVVGDRSPASPGAPQPFQKMPIEWERACAGSGPEQNPVGLIPGVGGALPNILDPEDPQRAAGFGPIASTWPARTRYLAGGTPPQRQGPFVVVPDSLAWDFFQSAPPDQQLATLTGHEEIVLDNLHQSLSRLQSRLPHPRGVARVYGGDAPSDGFPIELDLDTLELDGDAQSCSVVWRGCLMLEGDRAALALLHVVAGVEMPGFPMPWHTAKPTVVVRPAAAAFAVDDDDPDSSQDGGTLAFSPEEAQRLIASSTQRSAIDSPAKRITPPPPPPSGPPPAPPLAPRMSQLDLEVTAAQPLPIANPDTGVTNALPDLSAEPDEAPNEPTRRLVVGQGVGQGATRALSPEEAGALLAKAPRGPAFAPPPAPAETAAAAKPGTATLKGQGATRALSPEEAAALLASAPKPAAGAPLPGASAYLSGALPAPPPPPPAFVGAGAPDDEDLTDEETGATMAFNPEDAAALLSPGPVRAIVREHGEPGDPEEDEAASQPRPKRGTLVMETNDDGTGRGDR